jgi:non-heme chloroperoxidase
MLTPDTAMAAFWISMVTQDWRQQLSKIPVPILLCYGAKSAIFPTKICDHMKKHIPKNNLVIFENSGHSPFWEEPDKFNAEVAKFAG